MEDIVAQAKLLEWAGVSFNKLEWYKIKLAMSRIMTASNVLTLRFWGKIYGKENDYYIIQGSLKEYPLVKYTASLEQEPKGLEGANLYTFWVSNNVLEEWFELPNITIKQLETSRKFKYILTGKLDAKVKSFIDFPGKEAHLLKCQIVRIMSASSIVPDGYLELKNIENSSDIYGLDLTDKVTQVKEGFEFPGNDELIALEKWVHEYSYIYDNGKIIETNTDIETVGRLKSISEDKSIVIYLFCRFY